MFVVSGGSSFFSLVTRGGLTHLFSVESFECFFQKDPRYFKGVPLSYKEFVFDIPDYAAGNMAESEMVNLSKSESLEYSQEVFLFDFTTFTRGEIGVQGFRCFGKQVLMLRVVITRIAKLQL